MAEFPALPLWTDSYLADCSHLTDAEHGIYLQILMLMWRSPECRIPNDDDWIARKLRRDANAVRTHVRPVLDEFCNVDGAYLVQRRLLREWQWCRSKSKKNQSAAKLRWNKDSTVCERNANAMPTRQCERNAPTPTPTPLEKDKTKVLSKKAARLPADWKLPQEWGEWAEGEGMSSHDIVKEGHKFRDYWHAKAGKDAVKVDWQATWRNWIRRRLES